MTMTSEEVTREVRRTKPAMTDCNDRRRPAGMFNIKEDPCEIHDLSGNNTLKEMLFNALLEHNKTVTTPLQGSTRYCGKGCGRRHHLLLCLPLSEREMKRGLFGLVVCVAGFVLCADTVIAKPPHVIFLLVSW